MFTSEHILLPVNHYCLGMALSKSSSFWLEPDSVLFVLLYAFGFIFSSFFLFFFPFFMKKWGSPYLYTLFNCVCTCVYVCVVWLRQKGIENNLTLNQEHTTVTMTFSGGPGMIEWITNYCDSLLYLRMASRAQPHGISLSPRGMHKNYIHSECILPYMLTWNKLK